MSAPRGAAARAIPASPRRQTVTETAETIDFQAETKEILSLVIHSLYTHKEIFLRELISNASDALDKLRVLSLKEPELLEGDEELAIRLEIDRERRVLRVVDTGIGMSRQEVVENLGTIARSGTRGFLDALRSAKAAPAAEVPQLIGQFGVGFYASFMVADEVVVETRKAGEATGVRWRSAGEGQYTVEEIERVERGTSVALHLKPLARLEGEEEPQDFTDEAVLRAVVKRYSDFIEYPIRMEIGEGDETSLATLNSRKPLWTRPKADIDAEEHAEFYKHLSHDWQEPLETIHFKAEGATEYTALLYLPKERGLDLFDPMRARSHVSLYVKRVFIMADCEELLPPWLRFVRGVVDSADLPLNISRETLQHNRQMGAIRSRLVRKLLDVFGELLRERREDYVAFWRAFGPVIKEGIFADERYAEDIARVALFASSAGDAPTTLGEYVERMPVKQKAIQVLLAPDRRTAERSPHMEALRARKTEVLFLTDAVDEFVLQRLMEFDGKPIRQIDRGEADPDEVSSEARAARERKSKELDSLLEAVRKELADEVEAVRFSTRLTDSPACLVGSEHALSPQLERLLREAGQPVPERRRVLELNPTHPLVERLHALCEDDARHARFQDYCALLLGQAMLAEGSAPSDPARFSKLVADLMVGAEG
jgi:molecular chaperone HtpG